VQREVLAKNSNADLRVYTVWFNMLLGDARRRWDGDGMTDSRVTHLWDEQRAVGDWFSANVVHRPGTTWDFYALYPPDAGDLSSPVSSGGTIIVRRDALAADLQKLLRAT
jgi:hypothetical protein